MCIKQFSKYVCCSLDLTIASRIIAFSGIVISALLMTVLLNDRYFNTNQNYDWSRKTALAFGLDWQHFHQNASTAQQDDPEGRMISIIVIFYSVAFVVINLLLFFATIKCDWRCTIPWLACEFFGCLSKFGALVYHLCYDPSNLTNIFIIGSVIYIVIMVWWWLVVFCTQLSWRFKIMQLVEIEMSVLSSHYKEYKYSEDKLDGNARLVKEPENLDSPGPYTPNMMYALI